MENRLLLFLGVILGIQRQAAPEGDVLIRVGFVVRIDHIFLDRGEAVKLDQQMDKTRYDKNRKKGSKKQHKKVGDSNNCQNNSGPQCQFHHTYKQILFKIHKGQQKAVFIDLGGGQLEGRMGY